MARAASISLNPPARIFGPNRRTKRQNRAAAVTSQCVLRSIPPSSLLILFAANWLAVHGVALLLTLAYATYFYPEKTKEHVEWTTRCLEQLALELPART